MIVRTIQSIGRHLRIPRQLKDKFNGQQKANFSKTSTNNSEPMINFRTGSKGGSYGGRRAPKALVYAVGGVGTVYVLYNTERTPVTGRIRFIFISPETEKVQGEQTFNQLLRESNILPENHQYSKLIKKIGQRIATATGNTDFNWEFVVINDDSTMNAMCLPGGKVVFYSGLLKILESEGEVAGVMAHEISHALMRHYAENSGLMGVLNGVRILANVGLGFDIPPELFTFSTFLPRSRKVELEADLIGLFVMSRACYNPRDAISAFQRLQKSGAAELTGVAQYMSTHPTFEKRLAQYEKYIDKAERERATFCAVGHGNTKLKWNENLQLE